MERGFSAKLKTFSKDYMSLVAVIIIFIVFSFASPYFLKMSNVMNIFLQTATVAIVAIGQGMLSITGQVDLSLGYQVCLTGCVFAYMMKFQNWNPVAAILLAVVIGCVAGAANGFLVAYWNIPALYLHLLWKRLVLDEMYMQSAVEEKQHFMQELTQKQYSFGYMLSLVCSVQFPVWY